jgi:hypothetical protein
MGAPDIIRILHAQGDNRAAQLARSWPDLAVALAELCYQAEVRPPHPFMLAHKVTNGEPIQPDAARVYLGIDCPTDRPYIAPQFRVKE